MPEIPQQAVQAAARALWERDFSGYDECSHSYSEMPRLALVALEAGGPTIAEQARAEERARIVAQLRANAERFHGMAKDQETVGAGWQCHAKAFGLEEVAEAIEKGGSRATP